MLLRALEKVKNTMENCASPKEREMLKNKAEKLKQKLRVNGKRRQEAERKKALKKKKEVRKLTKKAEAVKKKKAGRQKAKRT
jgi:hypothetical protein